jgi:diadenylate cyclase
MNFAAQISWRNVADAVIVGALLYQLLRLIRRRRAGQILFGLLLLLGAFWAAEWLKFPLLTGILVSLRPYLGFAMIVLFQAEIRRGLAMLGGWNLHWGGNRRPSPYEDVVLAVGRFAQQKTGALIVLERQTGLRTHAESGIALDARLSYDLLLTIFHPESRIHDGAVVVMKDRIAAASCFLPLSVSPDRPRELGSRHRAALGITEETDAVALVVAEHTGVVSIAVGGALELGISEERLRERVAALFGKRAAAPAASVPAPAPPVLPELANNVTIMETPARRRDGA